MSLYTPEPEQQYPECSAKHSLKHRGIVVEYSAPPSTDTDVASRVLSCSDQNLVLFSRGNRVHFKNIVSNEEVGQLCKLAERHGDLRSIECGSKDRPELVALGTNKGVIQLWDINTKKTAMTWLSSAGVSAMRWNGSVLTVGSPKGTIRHYDIRVNPVTKMREQSRKLTRHQGQITSLDWNSEGKYLASGDSTGTVYCWMLGEKKPLEVGEFVQRRKKIQHDGPITAINFSPWRADLLATGDSTGVIRLWNVNPNSTLTNATTPGRIETTGAITGLHWSPQCKELLSTHGTLVPTSTDPFIPRKPRVADSIAVHSYPSLRHVTTLSLNNLPDSPIGDSILNANGTKLIFARPSDGKLHMSDIWAKRKEIKRQQSFMQNIIR
ncbi:WD40 repeat-like protein [Panaeolus papilionaceus]|nr:WD40 repeat-like protein [Panaeolus papilionaceus]